MPTFQDLTPVTERIVAAGDHLTLRRLTTGDFSCGCPGWNSETDHDADCPVAVIDDVMEAGNRLSTIMATLAAGNSAVTYEQVRVALSHLDDDVAPLATASATLALVGAARLYVTIAARTNGAEHDFDDPAIERYAVLHRLTYDNSVRLVAETAARLLLSPHHVTDMVRFLSRSHMPDGQVPTASDVPLQVVVPALLESVNAVMLSLPAPGFPDIGLGTLSVEGFNMLAGVAATARTV
jgi:hypothetical protein